MAASRPRWPRCSSTGTCPMSGPMRSASHVRCSYSTPCPLCGCISAKANLSGCSWRLERSWSHRVLIVATSLLDTVDRAINGQHAQRFGQAVDLLLDPIALLLQLCDLQQRRGPVAANCVVDLDRLRELRLVGVHHLP